MCGPTYAKASADKPDSGDEQGIAIPGLRVQFPSDPQTFILILTPDKPVSLL